MLVIEIPRWAIALPNHEWGCNIFQNVFFNIDAISEANNIFDEFGLLYNVCILIKNIKSAQHPIYNNNLFYNNNYYCFHCMISVAAKLYEI